MKAPISTTLLFISLTSIPNIFGASADNPTFKELSEKFIANIKEFSRNNTKNNYKAAKAAQKNHRELSFQYKKETDELLASYGFMKLILKAAKRNESTHELLGCFTPHSPFWRAIRNGNLGELKKTVAKLKISQSSNNQNQILVHSPAKGLTSSCSSVASNSSSVMLQPPTTDSSFYGSDDDYYDGAEDERIAQAIELSLTAKENTIAASSNSASCSNTTTNHNPIYQNIEKKGTINNKPSNNASIIKANTKRATSKSKEGSHISFDPTIFCPSITYQSALCHPKSPSTDDAVKFYNYYFDGLTQQHAQIVIKALSMHNNSNNKELKPFLEKLKTEDLLKLYTELDYLDYQEISAENKSISLMSKVACHLKKRLPGKYKLKNDHSDLKLDRLPLNILDNLINKSALQILSINKEKLNKVIDTHLLEHLFNQKKFSHADKMKGYMHQGSASIVIDGGKMTGYMHQESDPILIDKGFIDLSQQEKEEMRSNLNKCTRFIFDKLKNDDQVQRTIKKLYHQIQKGRDCMQKYIYAIYRLGIHTLLWLTYAQGGTLLSEKVFTEKFAPKDAAESKMCVNMHGMLSKICSPAEWECYLYERVPGENFSILSNALYELKLLEDKPLMGYELIAIIKLLEKDVRWIKKTDRLLEIIKNLINSMLSMHEQPLITTFCDYELRAERERSSVRWDGRLNKKALSGASDAEFLKQLPKNLVILGSSYRSKCCHSYGKALESSIRRNKKKIQNKLLHELSTTEKISKMNLLKTETETIEQAFKSLAVKTVNDLLQLIKMLERTHKIRNQIKSINEWIFECEY